ELNPRILDPRPGQQQTAPQFKVHRPVIIRIEPTRRYCQFAWKESLRLHNIASSPPDGCDSQQIFKRTDPSLVFGNKSTCLTHEKTCSGVDYVLCETCFHSVSH